MNSTSTDDGQVATPDVPPVDPSETRQPLVIGVTVTALFLATLVTALRVHVRARLLRKWGWDDSALVTSHVLVSVVGLLMLINTHFGDGLHQATLPRDKFLKSQEISITAVAIYQAAYALIKSTFLLQYRRVFPLPAFQKLCNIFLVFIIAFGISQVISLCLACIPLKSLWDHTVPGRCIRLLDWWMIGSSINLVTDIVIYVMPLPLLRTIPLPTRQKIVLMITFGLGFFTCAISVIRLTTLKSSSTSNDITYHTVIAGIWSITELSCAIICLCVPTLRPLLSGQNLRVRWPSYLRANIEENADTELCTQSDGDGAVKSKTRRSRADAYERSTSGHGQINYNEETGGGGAPHPRIDLSDVPGILPPPAVHRTPSQDSPPYENSPHRETVPLTRVDTEEGVRFLSVDPPEAELPTPLQPPPRRHTDRGASRGDGGYFGAVVWDT
ncbi:integral membrane protein [Colletotrichum orchidophilum]|uniref:Integral membrane protein n=1 Tax=Colletotrichum orchidophilum TaxID=1209926 RepID=A0A1G4AUY9_9PEZI|nr:uncharacterized protein CORC01_11792 [Colletotrichum orchidophilum]OHE92925.1 integral membrane protein [Colletotrichum orchidophilum]